MEKRFAIWVNSSRMTYPIGGEWMTTRPGVIRSFDTIEEATRYLLACGYEDTTEVKPGRATAYAAQNPRWWDDGIDRAERALGVQ